MGHETISSLDDPAAAEFDHEVRLGMTCIFDSKNRRLALENGPTYAEVTKRGCIDM